MEGHTTSTSTAEENRNLLQRVSAFEASQGANADYSAELAKAHQENTPLWGCVLNLFLRYTSFNRQHMCGGDAFDGLHMCALSNSSSSHNVC